MPKRYAIIDNTPTQIKGRYAIISDVPTRVKKRYAIINGEPVLVYLAQTDTIELRGTVTQGENSLNWKDVDYKIEEDWTVLTVVDSYWGKSFGEFNTALQLINSNGSKTTLVNRYGGYGGTQMDDEPIVASGTTFTVSKGQTIRLAVGAAFNPNVSGQHTTTSWIKFILS